MNAECEMGKSNVGQRARRTSLMGLAAAFSGAALWGVSGTCAQFLQENYGMSPLLLTLVRMLCGGALFVAVIVATRREELRTVLRNRALMKSLLVFGCAGLFPSQITYIVCIGYTNAGTATVLQAGSVVFVMLAACLLARKLPRCGDVLALFLALAATLCLATQGQLDGLRIPSQGLFWGLLNAASVALYIMYPKVKGVYAHCSSFTATGVGMVLGSGAAALFCVGVLLLQSLGAVDGVGAVCTVLGAGSTGGAEGMGGAGGAVAADAFTAQSLVWNMVFPALDASGWLALAGVVLVGAFAAYGLYMYGVSVVGPVKGALLGTMEPVGAMAVAACWLRTPFSLWDWAGLALMVATTVLVSRSDAEAV